MNIINWARKNVITAVLLLVVIYLVILKPLSQSFLGARYSNRSIGGVAPMMETFDGVSSAKMMATDAQTEMMPVPVNEAPPQAGSDRMVIQESNFSLLVKNVVETRNQILDLATKAGGYMVNANTANPGETPSANITIRVKATELESVLSELRSLAIKVVSEHLSGYDVTDQYVDIEKRIGIYEATKARYQAIMDQAREISDITQLTSQIINTQSQIDRLKGQQDYLKKNAELVKITIYLSTDEIALPYAPEDTWRPEVIFKMAVRSLITDLRGLGEKAIWLGVYAVIWVPALILGWAVWKFIIKRK
jgi:hypothetical protein